MAKEAKPRDNLLQNWYHENGADSWEEVAARLLMLSKLKARGHGLRQQREISDWCRAFDLEKYPPGEAVEGADWRAALDLIDRWDHELLLDLQTKAALVAKSKQREASKAGHQGFLDWPLTALRGGAGLVTLLAPEAIRSLSIYVFHYLYIFLFFSLYLYLYFLLSICLIFFLSRLFLCVLLRYSRNQILIFIGNFLKFL